MKLFVILAAGTLSVCACANAPGPTAPSATLIADAALTSDAYDPIFYRAFLQNAFESPNQLQPVRLWQSAPHFYLRTQDDAGHPIDADTLAMTERVLEETVPIWSGETFNVAEVVRGTATKDNAPGWITVKWSTTVTPDRCGRSTIGVDGGFMELNATGACSCGLPTMVYPRLVRHELGHAMGYYHTDSPRDVMYGSTIVSAACDLQPSDRERAHAELAHHHAE